MRGSEARQLEAMSWAVLRSDKNKYLHSFILIGDRNTNRKLRDAPSNFKLIKIQKGRLTLVGNLVGKQQNCIAIK